MSDGKRNIFIWFAVIFTSIEIFVIGGKISGWIGENISFNIASLILLPIVVFGELLILLLESNKITISYFPYTLVLQDLGAYYGIAGQVKDDESGVPLEESLRILLKRKGSWGSHKLIKLAFEVREVYSVEWIEDSEIPITSHEKINLDNNLVRHEFMLESTEMKENQVTFEFRIRRTKISGSYMRDFYCMVILESSYKFLLRTKSNEKVRIPSAIV